MYVWSIFFRNISNVFTFKVGEEHNCNWTALEEEEDDDDEEVVEDEESTDIESEGEEPGDVYELF